MVVAPPLVEHVFGEVHRAHELWEVLTGDREMTPVDLAEQILARNRHVVGVRRTQEIVALVRAGAAFYAGIQEHSERAVFAEQVAHLGNGDIVPVIHQLAWKPKRLLMGRCRHERPAMGHRPHFDGGYLGILF